ncbi:MAG: macrocin O-methyltransferase [Bacteroidales bacterium]|nr:macrocin O-methyltransferase [Bacteroidales bacterium]
MGLIEKIIGKFSNKQCLSNIAISIRDVHIENSIIFKASKLIASDKIEGDYLEFGVFRGDSFIHAYNCVRKAFKQATERNIWNTEEDCRERGRIYNKMRFFAFDSFQGLPDIKNIDSTSKDFVKGKFSCSEGEFNENVRKNGLPEDKVISLAGWFEETVNKKTFEKHNITKVSIINIDCDLYESAKTVLDNITPLLIDGTVIIFDDWYNFKGNPNLGEQRACREWLEANPDIKLSQYQKEGPWKNSFIVYRK